MFLWAGGIFANVMIHLSPQIQAALDALGRTAQRGFGAPTRRRLAVHEAELAILRQLREHQLRLALPCAAGVHSQLQLLRRVQFGLPVKQQQLESVYDCKHKLERQLLHLHV